MVATTLYSCFDFCLRSEIPLAELVPAGEAGARAIVDVRLGRVPAELAGGRTAAKGLQVSGDAVMLTIEGIARYLVRGGREIVVDPAPGGSERNLRLFLLGSALGILCHQRGLLPLHANAIVAGGGAYAFAGRSGAGKSTLAAHFGRAGYEILCDDVCVISFDDGGRPVRLAGAAPPQAVGRRGEAFGHDRADARSGDRGDGQISRAAGAGRGAETGPVPPALLLARSDDGAGARHLPAAGPAGDGGGDVADLSRLHLGPMGLAARHFRQCAALLAHAEVYEARRDLGL